MMDIVRNTIELLKKTNINIDDDDIIYSIVVCIDKLYNIYSKPCENQNELLKEFEVMVNDFKSILFNYDKYNKEYNHLEDLYWNKIQNIRDTIDPDYKFIIDSINDNSNSYLIDNIVKEIKVLNTEEVKENIRQVTKSLVNNLIDPEYYGNMFLYLNDLNYERGDLYTQFGSDKCYCNNVHKFLEDIDICYEDLKKLVAKYPLGMDTNIKDRKLGYPLYTLYSKDKKLVMSVSSRECLGGSFYYFGLTGEISRVMIAYHSYKKYCVDDELVWGDRNFI